jgi:hypothetical protein
MRARIRDLTPQATPTGRTERTSCLVLLHLLLLYEPLVFDPLLDQITQHPCLLHISRSYFIKIFTQLQKRHKDGVQFSVLINPCRPSGLQLRDAHWFAHPWKGSAIKRSRFKWIAEFGPLPDGWDVHHLDPCDALDDEPLIGTLAMPGGEHARYHCLKDRRIAEAILTRWFFYWADRLR